MQFKIQKNSKFSFSGDYGNALKDYLFVLINDNYWLFYLYNDITNYDFIKLFDESSCGVTR